MVGMPLRAGHWCRRQTATQDNIHFTGVLCSINQAAQGKAWIASAIAAASTSTCRYDINMKKSIRTIDCKDDALVVSCSSTPPFILVCGKREREIRLWQFQSQDTT